MWEIWRQQLSKSKAQTGVKEALQMNLSFPIQVHC